MCASHSCDTSVPNTRVAAPRPCATVAASAATTTSAPHASTCPTICADSPMRTARRSDTSPPVHSTTRLPTSILLKAHLPVPPVVVTPLRSLTPSRPPPPRAPVRAAAQRAVRPGWVPTLGWVYLTDHYAPHAQALLDELQRAWPGVAWVGSVGGTEAARRQLRR